MRRMVAALIVDSSALDVIGSAMAKRVAVSKNVTMLRCSNDDGGEMGPIVSLLMASDGS